MRKKSPIDWKATLEGIGHSLFDYSLARTLNSIILVYLLVIFLKLFVMGVHAKLLTDYFQILVVFGLLIILFSVVPIMLAGWGGIMNVLILFFGLLYIIDSSNTFFFPSIKLVILFAIFHICWKIYIYYEEKRKDKIAMKIFNSTHRRKHGSRNKPR
jgi:hypothetical protein